MPGVGFEPTRPLRQNILSVPSLPFLHPGRDDIVGGVQAMVLESAGKPLRLVDLSRPEPGEGQRLIRVEACGVCRTDLHLRDGEVSIDSFPRVLGHQIVGVDEDGARVGVPWLAWTCGECRFCRAGRE